MRFSKKIRDRILENLEKDVALLQRHNVMDYSLLFAIEYNPSYKRPLKAGSRSISSNSVENDADEEGNKVF